MPFPACKFPIPLPLGSFEPRSALLAVAQRVQEREQVVVVLRIDEFARHGPARALDQLPMASVNEPVDRQHFSCGDLACLKRSMYSVWNAMAPPPTRCLCWKVLKYSSHGRCQPHEAQS